MTDIKSKGAAAQQREKQEWPFPGVSGRGRSLCRSCVLSPHRSGPFMGVGGIPTESFEPIRTCARPHARRSRLKPTLTATRRDCRCRRIECAQLCGCCVRGIGHSRHRRRAAQRASVLRARRWHSGVLRAWVRRRGRRSGDPRWVAAPAPGEIPGWPCACSCTCTPHTPTQATGPDSVSQGCAGDAGQRRSGMKSRLKLV
jgi:hypothetical protein